MTTLTERPISSYRNHISPALIMIGLIVVGLNLEFYARALELSSALIPNAPDIHLFAPQGFAVIFAVGSQPFDFQPVIGMLMALLLFLFGPALLITVLLRNSHGHPIIFSAVSFPLLFIFSVNVDWLFVQFLHLEGLPWFIAISVFSAFAVKAILSLFILLNPKHGVPLNTGSLYLIAFIAPLGLLLLKTFLTLSLS